MRLVSWTMAFVLMLVATVGVGAQQSQIGLRLGVQPWTPVTNDDTVQFLLDDPSIISRTYDKGWPRLSREITAALTKALSTPNLVADDVTFYDIDIQLTQPLFTIERLDGSGVPGDPYHLTLDVRLNNESITLTSTTPTVCDSGCDPRCNFVVDVDVRIDLTIQNTISAAFASRQTNSGGEPIVQITRFDFAAGNLVCGIAVGLAEVLGIKDAIGKIVSQPDGLVNKPLAEAVRDFAAEGVAFLNNAVAAYQRPELNLIILRAWLMPQPGGGKSIVLNLAPRAPLPDPTAGQGALIGVLSAGAAQGIKSGKAGTVDCSQLPVRVSRVTGPRPMTSPYGTLGEWPLELLAVKSDCDARVLSAGQKSNYRISGMSLLFPQLIEFGSVRGKCVAYQASVRQGIDVKTPTWVQGILLPQDIYSRPHDATANFTSIVCGGQAPAYIEPKDRFLKFLFDKQEITPNPIILEITREYMTSRGISLSLLETIAPRTPVLVPQSLQKAQAATPQSDPCSPNAYEEDPGTAGVTASVNVRAGDSTRCDVIGQLAVGSRVDVLSCTLSGGGSSSWCQINFGPNGARGYVSKRYLAFGSADADEVVMQDVPNDEIIVRIPNRNDESIDDEEFDDQYGDVVPEDVMSSGEDDLPADMPEETPNGRIDCALPRNAPFCE